MKKLLKNKWTYILLSLLTTAILCLSLGLNFVGGGRTDLALTTNTTSADGPTNTGYWTDTATQTALGVDFTNYSLSGSGTAESPYQINSETDLAFLSWTIYTDNVYGGSGNKTTSGSLNYFYSGKYFKQTKDLDLSAYYWQPIGIYYLRDGTTVYRYFSGNYDGGGFTISGLYTPAGSGNAYSNQGLFGNVWTYNTVAVSITNIGVIDSFIQGYNNVGGVVGRVNNYSTITNCYNTGAVTGNGGAVGGVVGYAYNSTITNCYNTGSVTLTATYNNNVGGVVGYASNLTITNCYNTGTVTGSSGEGVGGAVGRAYSNLTITNCYNTGTVEGSGWYVGGVVGYAYASSSSSQITIINCYNTGFVTGNSYVGGVVGRAGSNATITNTYYGGNCTLKTGIGSGSGSATKMTALVEEWATNIDWYSTSATNEDGSLVWDSAYPWDFDTVWEFVRAPDYINLHYNINNGYPVLCGMWSIPDDAEIIYWTDDVAQTALDVDFTNYSLSGSGTAESPYQINSETDLAFLSWTIYNNKAYNGNVTSSRFFYSSKYFKQTKNLDMSAYYWQPIGIRYLRDGTYAQRYFSSNYDGGGHTISGLYTPAGSNNAYSYQGLFGYVYGYSSTQVTISNIGVIDSFIQGYNYVGGVVGSAGSSTITNCYNTGTVTGSRDCVGGVVGYAYSNSTITNCYNTNSVEGSGSSVGGVVGYAYSNSTITNCYNTGTVTGSGNYVGGVVGHAGSATITNCYNTGAVTGNSYIGGVVGYAYMSTLTNCGVETTQISGNSKVGVLVGSGDGSTTITNCYGIVGVDIDFASVGTYDNCVWITNVDGVVNKYYHGTDFSAFAWFNPNSCPIPKSLSSLGQFWTGDITPTLTDSSEWQEVA